MLLYYGHSVDPIIICTVNGISQVQSKPTEDTKNKSVILL